MEIICSKLNFIELEYLTSLHYLDSIHHLLGKEVCGDHLIYFTNSETQMIL